MVRFIISVIDINTDSHSLIYIPIWLDLLLKSLGIFDFEYIDLHSNMVRFIISLWYGIITL